MNDLASLYRDAILKHAAKPVGYRQPIEVTHQHEAENPLCGDHLLVQLNIVNDRVEAAAFNGEACAICMASASLLCEILPGKPASQIAELHDRLHAALENRDELDGAEALKPLLGVRPYPGRIRCATLPWSAATNAL